MASRSSTKPSHFKGPNLVFEFDFGLSRDLPVGACITSQTFTAGGYDWALDFYPYGDVPEKESPFVSLFLCLKSEFVKDITAECSFKLLNKYAQFIDCFRQVDNFTSGMKSCGSAKFMNRYSLEQNYSVYDKITISCGIKVLTATTDVHTDPGGLCEHIGKLWENMESADIIFEVEGENISAHRLILAARSPVFAVKLYGPMAEAKMAHIKIEEMKADVFKALLHFIYTDQLSNNGFGDHPTFSAELLQDLFAAADRYALDKLSLLCEEKLVLNLCVGTVAATLLFADCHSRVALKGKCVDFATDPENFSLVALTDGYLQIMQGAPSLFSELSEKVKGSMNKSAKKQRTV